MKRLLHIGTVLVLSVFAIGAVSRASERAGWKLDPNRTRIGFAIDAVGFPRTHGEFRAFQGRLAINFDQPALSRVAFTVDSASIDVGSASFDGVLRGAAFLDSQRFPEIRFESANVEKLDEKTARVSGELTLLGVSNPLQVLVDVSRRDSGARLGFVAHAHIDRLAFGMNSGYPVISRDVELIVSSEAVAQ